MNSSSLHRFVSSWAESIVPHFRFQLLWLEAIALLCCVAGLYVLLKPGAGSPVIARLKGLKWRRTQFCRGWLITGDTGSGKTSSGINQLLHQVFWNEPRWGGLCIDEKGIYWETLRATAAKHNTNFSLRLHYFQKIWQRR